MDGGSTRGSERDVRVLGENGGASPRTPHHHPSREALVDRIVARLSDDVGPERFERFFHRQTKLSVEDGRLEVRVPTGFVADLIGRRFGESLRRAVEAEFNDHQAEPTIRVDRSVFEDRIEAPGEDIASPTTIPVAPPRRGKVGRRKHGDTARDFNQGFEDFIVGASNRLAHDASVALAEPGGPRGMNLLFIHGPSGLGKSLLLSSIAKRRLELDPGSRVRFVTCETFVDEFVQGVRNDSLEKFRREFRGVELLCLDDAQYLAGKKGSQVELVHALDAMLQTGARIAVASDVAPHDLRSMEPRLVSRLVSGMVAAIDPPQRDMCGQLVRSLAARRGLVIEPAGIETLADAFFSQSFSGARSRSVRELEGLLAQVHAMHCIAMGSGAGGMKLGGGVSVATVRQALELVSGSVRGSTPGKPVAVKTILRVVSDATGVAISDMMTSCRRPRFVAARSLACHVAREITSLSYPEVARAMGRSSHSTVVSACKRMEAWIAQGKNVDIDCELDGLSYREASEALAQRARRAASA